MEAMPTSLIKEELGHRAPATKVEHEKAAFLKDLLMLSSGKYISLLIMFIRGFVIPKLLDPALFGTWKSLLIISTFARVGHLGTVSALTREVPFYIGKRDDESLNRIKNTAFTTSVLSAGLTSLGILVASFLVSDPFIAMCLRWFAALVMVQQIIIFGTTYLSGCQEFGFLARINVFQSVFLAVMSVGLAWLYGLSGLIFGTVLSSAVFLFLIMLKLRFAVRFQFPWATVVQLVRAGLPLLCTGLLYSVLHNVDKLIIIRWLGMKEMGYYALGYTVVHFVFQLAQMFGSVLSPRLIKRYSANERVADVRGYVLKPLIILTAGMPLLLVGCYFVSEWLYNVYLPDYLPGLNSLKILIGGMYFGTLWVGLIAFFLSIQKQTRMIPIYVAAILLNAALSYGFVRAGHGIDGVAWGTSITQCFFSFAIIIYAASHFYNRKGEYLRRFANILFPFFYSVALVLIVEAGGRSLFESPSGLLVIAAKFACFSALYSPLLLRGYRTAGMSFKQLLRNADV
jgi:O-antigen/teichoic acid export membrane protein